MKILLVNPPIYDFTAYDFWLRPYGLMQAGGHLRSAGELFLFDYLDRFHPAFDPGGKIHTDPCGRGSYPHGRIPKPDCLKDIRRYYRRFGIDRAVLQAYLAEQGPFDVVLIQTVMTYWYPGVQEVIDDVRRLSPQAKVVLGGVYATVCPDHAAGLGADMVINGDDFGSLYQLLEMNRMQDFHLPVWDLYPQLKTGVIKLTRGCPFRCSYCYVPQSGAGFSTRPLDKCLAELDQLVELGAENIAFYDDALLFQPEKILVPFLEAVIEKNNKINFHTPNALHARFITADLAELMVRAGVKTYYLGFESSSEAFHIQTDSGKVVSDELAQAVDYLKAAGANPRDICAYEILGHPNLDAQQLEASMRFVNSLGIQIMLSDFSPIPGTPDGDLCEGIVDLTEPLNHNKTAFTVCFLGFEKAQYYKDLCKALNKTLKG
ncbi:MAG: B12-binding domain-containing radical SAM protein [Planctomycetota bacterium]|jgi:pyruvate-formate lyase-activating enzyme